MRWLVGILLGGILGAGCGKTVYRSHEGQYCSSTANDDPFFECSPSYDLVCINTYAQQIAAMAGSPERFQEIFLCRLACQPNDRCPDLTDVCCPGPIYGRNYGQMHACVPAGMCQTVPVTDAGAPDARQDGPADGPAAPPDAATPDAAPDGPATADSGPGDAGGADASASD